MAVEVMAWNVLDAFSDEGRARGVLKVVQKKHPHAAVFPEAWREGSEGLLDDVFEELDKSEYTVTHGLYEDNDGREDRHGIIGIVRKDAAADQKPYIVRLGNRNAVHVPLVNRIASGSEDVFDFFGVHLDDRSEQGRLTQVDALMKVAEFSGRVIIGGDFNAMYRHDPRAKVLRCLRPIARRMPTVDPRPDFKPPKLKRIGSLASRLTDMATGTTMQQFEAAGFENTDPRGQPTKGPFTLDYIVSRGLVPFAQSTHVENSLSDHRAIRASFYPRPKDLA